MCIPNDTIENMSTLVDLMAWCHQVTGHYLNECCPYATSIQSIATDSCSWHGRYAVVCCSRSCNDITVKNEIKLKQISNEFALPRKRGWLNGFLDHPDIHCQPLSRTLPHCLANASWFMYPRLTCFTQGLPPQCVIHFSQKALRFTSQKDSYMYVHRWPLLLIRIDVTHSMDMQLYAKKSMG